MTSIAASLPFDSFDGDGTEMERIERFVGTVLASSPDNDAIDAAAHRLIAAFEDERLSEIGVRRGITILVKYSEVHKRAISSFNGLTQDVREEMAEAVFDVVAARLQDNSKGNGYCLQVGSRTSVCGWASNLAQPVAKSELRRHNNHVKLNGTQIDPSSLEYASATPRNSSTVTWSDGENRVGAEDQMDLHNLKVKGMRTTDRRFANVETIIEYYGLKPLIRPLHHAERDALRDQIEDDKFLAARSLRAYKALIEGITTKAALSTVLDERLLLLWDDYSAEDIDELLDLDASIANELAITACSPMPRPSNPVLKKITSGIRKTARNRSQTWMNLTAGLSDAWVASQFEACSEYATPNDRTKQIKSGHTIARSRLDNFVKKMAAFEGNPMGRTPVEVLEKLRDITTTLLTDEAAARRDAVERRLADDYRKKIEAASTTDEIADDLATVTELVPAGAKAANSRKLKNAA